MPARQDGVENRDKAYFSCTLLSFTTTQKQVLKESSFLEICIRVVCYFYFGGERSKGFATLRNVSRLPFFDKIGHAKSVGFWFYSAISQSESRISWRYLEITSISLIYSLTFSRKKGLLFWLPPGFEPTHLCDPSGQRRL